MNLAEMLDELRSNMLRDVSDALGTTGDKLWSDATLVRYINEGYRRFARRTLCIRDDVTPEVTRIVLQAGVDRYELHEAVLAVNTARVSGKPYDMHKLTHDALVGSVTNSTGAMSTGFPAQPGEPRQYTVEEGKRVLKIFPAPSTDFDGVEIELRVARMPMENLVTASPAQQTPEVSEDYHFDILEWAAYRALRNHDVDAENIQKASAHRRRFDEAVEEAVQDRRRETFAPVQFHFGSARW